MFRTGVIASVIAAGIGLTSPALAQDTVYMPAVLELSGAGGFVGAETLLDRSRRHLPAELRDLVALSADAVAEG